MVVIIMTAQVGLRLREMAEPSNQAGSRLTVRMGGGYTGGTHQSLSPLYFEPTFGQQRGPTPSLAAAQDQHAGRHHWPYIHHDEGDLIFLS